MVWAIHAMRACFIQAFQLTKWYQLNFCLLLLPRDNVLSPAPEESRMQDQRGKKDHVCRILALQ